MINDRIAFEKVDYPEDAPYYDDNVKLLKMKKAIVIRNGMGDGKPTVEIQFEDSEGKVIAVTIASLNLLNVIASVATAVRN